MLRFSAEVVQSVEHVILVLVGAELVVQEVQRSCRGIEEWCRGSAEVIL